jgi:hypothetical protein
MDLIHGPDSCARYPHLHRTNTASLAAKAFDRPSLYRAPKEPKEFKEPTGAGRSQQRNPQEPEKRRHAPERTYTHLNALERARTRLNAKKPRHLPRLVRYIQVSLTKGRLPRPVVRVPVSPSATGA